MKLNPLTVTKFAVSGIVGIGTSKIVGKIIKAHVTPETLIDKMTMGAAAWAIGGVVGEHTKKYTNDRIDAIAKVVSKAKADISSRRKLERINRGESTFESEGLDQSEFRMNEETEKWERISVPTEDDVPANS